MNRGDAATDARAFLGVFGKHPGWNDHIDDIGLSTDRLVQIKRVLYVEGIGGNIDAGAWDALPDSGKLPEFDHLFLWRTNSELVLGRFWSSTDGKGRKRYPMVVAAQIRGWPVSWQLKYVLPVLERLEDDFKSATTSDRVIALTQNAAKELEALTAGDPAPSTRFEATATSVLAGDPALGPERRGLYRLLYQMERDLSAYLRGGGKETSRSRTIDLTPRHLRVPRAAAADPDALLLWWRFMGEHVGESTPLVFLVPKAAPFVDILVGEPGVSQFTCALANQTTIPLTTEIPYSYDAAFVTRADERISGAAAPPSVDQPGKKLPPVVAPPAAVGKALGKLKAAGGGLEQRQLVMLAAAGVLGLIVLIGLIALLSGAFSPPPASTSGSSAARQDNPPAAENNTGSTPRQTPTQGGGTATPAANPAFTQQQRDDFAEWCDSVAWAMELRQGLASRDLAPLAADPHLAQTLVPLLETLRSPTFEIDPRTATPGGPRQIAQLRDQPPASAQSPEGLAKTAAALRVCRGIRASIQPTAWPARAQLDRAASAARDAGWTSLADAVAQVAASANISNADGLASLEAVTRASRPAGELLTALSTFNLSQEALGAIADPRLAQLRELLPAVDPGPGAAPADRVAAAAARMQALAALASELRQTAEARWPQLDTEFFLAAPALQPPATGVTEAYYRQWMQEARRDAYVRVDPAADPRARWDVPDRATAMRTQLDALTQPGSSADPAVVQALQTRLTTVDQQIAAAAALPWNLTQKAAVERAADDLDRTLASIEGEHEALTGRLAEQWERVITRLRERDALPGIDSPALSAAWVQRRDALLARFTTPDRLNTLNDRVEDLEDFLSRIDAAIPAPPTPDTLPRSIDADALERALADRREQAVAALLSAAPWSDDRYDPSFIDAQAPSQARALGEFADRVAQASRSAARVESLLAAAYVPDEPAPDGATINNLLKDADPAKVGPEVADVLAPIGDQVRALSSLMSQREPARLADLAADARAPLAAALAAWRALPDAGWPADTPQLAREAQIAAALTARVAAIADPQRRDALAAEIRAAQPTRWTHAAQRVQTGTDQAALRQVLASRQSFNVPIDALSPALRFSVLAADFAARAAQIQSTTDDAALKALASTFLADVQALALPDDALAPVAPWLAQVRDLTADEPAAPVIDPTTLGPATAGWRGQQIDDRRVRFTAPSGSVWLEYVLVEPGDHASLTAPAYVCTTELSVAALQAIVDSPARLAELQTLIADNPPESGAGPKTWLVRARAGQTTITPADGWYGSREVAEGIRPFGSAPVPARPGGKTPVTHLAAETAVQIAGWIGCRLPTIGEWQAAFARYESSTPAGDWNLRDATWAAQRGHVEAILRERMGINYPDQGIFLSDDSDAPTGEDATAGSGTDGTLFFDDVDRPRGRVLLNLVGNVHELATLGGVGETPRFGVVGRSALSPPEDDGSFMAGVEILDGDETLGWADVGMRPAFGLEGGSGELPLWRRAQRVGSAAPVLVGPSPGGGG